jgi:aspartate/methionine/tyrosine aminotransferase
VAFPLFLTRLFIRAGIARWLPALHRWTDGGRDFLHYYSDRVLAAPHAELTTAGAFLEAPGPDVIDLTLGAPRFDLMPSASVKLPAERRGCPPVWGLRELQDAVADKVQADHGVSVRPADEVLVTAGVAGAFNLALDAFVNPGDKVVLFDPTSPLYWFCLRQRRARICWVPTWTEKGCTRFRFELLGKALRGARMLILNAPANPTGSVLAAEDLEQIAWWADRRDVLLFNDEAWARYQYEGDRASILDVASARGRTLTAGSVSKSHALTAARVGWLTGERHLIRPCALTAALQGALVPTLCQQLAVTALRQGDESFQPIHAEFDARRRYALERLHALELPSDWPAGAFFLWLPVWPLGITGRAFAERLLRTHKVLAWPGEYFGPGGVGHVRLSYAGEDGRLREGLSRLSELVRELREQPASAQKRAA